MAYNTVYRDPSAWSPPPAKKAGVQTALGTAGLAAVVLACAWTIYSNVLGPAVEAMAPDLPQVTFVPGATAALSTKVAELDVTGALPPPSEPSSSFAERFLARSDDQPQPSPLLAKGDRLPVAQPQTFTVASLAPEPLPEPAATSESEATRAPAPETRDAQLPLPEIKQAASAIPLPLPRPAALRAAANEGPSRQEATTANRAAALAAINSQPKLSIFEKLFGRQERGPSLAFASPDGGITSDGTSLTPGRYDRQTAVYDISARTVYMPDGTKLEAHSGLGSKMDDPRFVHVRMHGATPPHTYDLAMRESLFHGVEAIRLHPVGGKENVHNRTGLLAHSYMLGPNGDSNGCVSFKDYGKFLRAFKNNEVKRLVVVAKLD